MSRSEDVVSEVDIDDGTNGDTGDDLDTDAESIICTVTFQSSPTGLRRSLIIPG